MQWLSTIPNSEALTLTLPTIPLDSSTCPTAQPITSTEGQPQPAAVKYYSALAPRSQQPLSSSASTARNEESSNQQHSASLPSSDGEWVVWNNKRVRNFKRFRKVWPRADAESSPHPDSSSAAGVREQSSTSFMSSSTPRITWRAVKPFTQRESELPDDNFSEEFAQPLSAAPHVPQFPGGIGRFIQYTIFY